MKICIIQEESCEGIPDQPRIYRREREADEVYIACVNENYHRNFRTLNGAMTFMADVQEGYYIRYWVMEVPKK